MDECHKVRNPRTQTYMQMLKFNAEYRLGLSGLYFIVMIYLLITHTASIVNNHYGDFTSHTVLLSCSKLKSSDTVRKGFEKFLTKPQLELYLRTKSKTLREDNPTVFPFMIRRLLKNVEPELLKRMHLTSLLDLH